MDLGEPFPKDGTAKEIRAEILRRCQLVESARYQKYPEVDEVAEYNGKPLTAYTAYEMHPLERLFADNNQHLQFRHICSATLNPNFDGLGDCMMTRENLEDHESPEGYVQVEIGTIPGGKFVYRSGQVLAIFSGTPDTPVIKVVDFMQYAAYSQLIESVDLFDMAEGLYMSFVYMEL